MNNVAILNKKVNTLINIIVKLQSDVNKLKENNFQVQYYHPNTLFINWNHWIPSYIRNEYKKQTGQSINEFGETIIEEKEEEYNNDNPILMIGNGNSNKNKNNKKYNSILNYVPTGSFN